MCNRSRVLNKNNMHVYMTGRKKRNLEPDGTHIIWGKYTIASEGERETEKESENISVMRMGGPSKKKSREKNHNKILIMGVNYVNVNRYDINRTKIYLKCRTIIQIRI